MSSPHSPENTSLPEVSLTQDTPALDLPYEGSAADERDVVDVSERPDVPKGPEVLQGPDALQGSDGPEVSGQEKWGTLARAICLFGLLGMALVVFARLGLGNAWTTDFLAKNRLSMTERMTFIYQMLGGGLLGGLVPPVLLLVKPPYRQSVAACERYAWFLSPLLLLPAIPVFGRHQVWFSKHEEFLPIVLFGALIFEVLFSKASENAPEKFTKWLVDFFRDAFGPSESRVRRFLTQHGALLFVCAAALVYGAFMSFYTVRWHHKLGTAIFDLGINNNLMSGGLEGHFNESSVIFPDNPKMYVANHVKAGLYVFLPIYALFPRPETLLIIQSVSLGLGAIPLFLFVRRRLPELWAVTLTVAYLCYYPLHGANFYEMKEPPTAAAIVLACIWAIDTKRYAFGGVCFAWALIMREDMPIPLAVVGACFLLSGERPRAGLIMAAIATSWFVFLRFGVMNDAGSWWFPNMYEDLWAAPEKGFQGVIKTLVSNPSYTLRHIFVEKKFWYLLHMLVPLAFLPTRRWWAFASFVPGAILTLLVTDYDPPITFSFQYVMHFAPYTFVASALVLSAMRTEKSGIHRARGAFAAMCFASLALTYNYGAFSLRDKALSSGYHKITFSFTDKERKTLADVRHLVASIPPRASVAATERVGAHLSSRYAFYTLRRGSHGAEYIVARESELRLDRTKDSVKKALTSNEYGVAGRFGEFVVLRKGADPKHNSALIEEWHLNSTLRSSKTTKKPRTKPRDRAGATDTADAAHLVERAEPANPEDPRDPTERPDPKEHEEPRDRAESNRDHADPIEQQPDGN